MAKVKVLELFADKNYLSKWKSDTELGERIFPKAAVTNVSWYAAKDYCACQGKRLPSMDEWGFATMASQTQANAQRDSIFNRQIIEGYEIPKPTKKTLEVPIKTIGEFGICTV